MAMITKLMQARYFDSQITMGILKDGTMQIWKFCKVPRKSYKTIRWNPVFFKSKSKQCQKWSLSRSFEQVLAVIVDEYDDDCQNNCDDDDDDYE